MFQALTVIEQLGGNKFLAMTGARDFVSNDNSLSFRVPSRSANFVTVVLDPSDTYTVKFSLVRGAVVKVVKELSGVYCDMLPELFTSVTGLETSL